MPVPAPRLDAPRADEDPALDDHRPDAVTRWGARPARMPSTWLARMASTPRQENRFGKASHPGTSASALKHAQASLPGNLHHQIVAPATRRPCARRIAPFEEALGNRWKDFNERSVANRARTGQRDQRQREPFAHHGQMSGAIEWEGVGLHCPHVGGQLRWVVTGTRPIRARNENHQRRRHSETR